MITNDNNSPSTQLDALRQENELLRASVQQSSSEVALLRAQRDQLLEEQHAHLHKIDGLQHQLQMALRRNYGRSSEKVDPKQRLLFEDFIDKAIPEIIPDEVPGDGTRDQSTPKRKGHGRRKLPSNLPRKTVMHDLPEDEKPCPHCNTMRHIIGKQTHEQLEYIPAKLKVIKHVRLTYGCPKCERDASPEGSQIVTADKPSLPIEKGLAAPGLLSYIIVSKYGDHCPMHRLERILQRYDIKIARSTMCDWAAQCADVLSPLLDLMQQRILQSKVLHTDDTPVDVQDKTLGRMRIGRFWIYLGDETQPYNVFAYTPNRKRAGPMAFLRDWGKHEPVYLQADAFGGYDGIYRGEAGGDVTEVACWAHARRKIYDARKCNEAVSSQALAYIRLLYDVESKAKKAANKAVKQAGNDSAQEHAHLVTERYRLRQAHSVSRLVEFKTWLQSQQAVQGGPVLPKSALGDAIQYAFNHWDALCTYTTDGRLAIDNNAAENALRHVAVGRKNWLFVGSDNGGRTAATLFSLIATCNRHKINPIAYLRDVLTRIPAIPLSQLPNLLPNRWQSANK